MFHPCQKIPSVSAVDACAKVKNDNVLFIDVRSPAEYQGGHAVGAINMPLETVPAHIEKLKGYAEVYAICQSGGRSGSATGLLIGDGVNAINVSGGTSAWQSAGLPME
jgi:rhodanese-related sulfurtransferase